MMFNKDCKHCACNDQAMLALRIVLAIVLVMHGYDKLFGATGIDGFTGFLTTLGFPAAAFFAWVASLLEFFGGIAIAVGLWTRYVSGLVAIQFAIILLFVKKLAFPASDLDLVIFGAALALALVGSGAWSCDAKMMKKGS